MFFPDSGHVRILSVRFLALLHRFHERIFLHALVCAAALRLVSWSLALAGAVPLGRRWRG